MRCAVGYTGRHRGSAGSLPVSSPRIVQRELRQLSRDPLPYQYPRHTGMDQGDSFAQESIGEDGDLASDRNFVTVFRFIVLNHEVVGVDAHEILLSRREAWRCWLSADPVRWPCQGPVGYWKGIVGPRATTTITALILSAPLSLVILDFFGVPNGN